MHRSKLVLATLATLALASAAGQSRAQTLNTLVAFGGSNAVLPNGNLTLSADGTTLYGTTAENSPTAPYGTIYSVPVTGGTPTTLYSIGSFNDPVGFAPTGGLVLSGSKLYGTNMSGGPSNSGVIYSLPTSGGTPTVLGTTGYPSAVPLSLTLMGSTLYGEMIQGGAHGNGAIYSIPATGGTPTILASFQSPTAYGPLGGLTFSADGSTIYGMTQGGGGSQNDGTVFSLPVGGGTPTTLATFNGPDGALVEGGLTLVGSTLYGTTTDGGEYGYGEIFSLPVTGGTPTVLYSFGSTNGSPGGDLTLIGSTLYGVANAFQGAGDGQIFSIPVGGGPLTTLFTFDGTDGSFPKGTLTPSADGTTLYGATGQGGLYNDGTLFALHLTPEPSSVVLLGLGAIGLGALALGRRMRRQAA